MAWTILPRLRSQNSRAMKARTILSVLRGRKLDKTNTTGYYTVGTHAHPSFREWSDWLRTQYLSR